MHVIKESIKDIKESTLRACQKTLLSYTSTDDIVPSVEKNKEITTIAKLLYSENFQYIKETDIHEYEESDNDEKDLEEMIDISLASDDNEIKYRQENFHLNSLDTV